VDIKEKWDGWYVGTWNHVCPRHDFNECGEGKLGMRHAELAAGLSNGVAPQASIVGVKVLRVTLFRGRVLMKLDRRVLLMGMSF